MDLELMDMRSYGKPPVVIPLDGSIEQFNYGRLFLVRDENDLQTIKAVYDDLGKEAAMLYSHTYSKGDILLQMGGDVSDEDFALYTAVIDEVVE